MTGSKVFPFEFSRVDLLYESYNGINVRLRYLLRVTVTRMYASTCTRDFPLWVRNTHTVPAINNSIKMEVRAPSSLHSRAVGKLFVVPAGALPLPVSDRLWSPYRALKSPDFLPPNPA